MHPTIFPDFKKKEEHTLSNSNMNSALTDKKQIFVIALLTNECRRIGCHLKSYKIEKTLDGIDITDVVIVPEDIAKLSQTVKHDKKDISRPTILALQGLWAKFKGRLEGELGLTAKAFEDKGGRSNIAFIAVRVKEEESIEDMAAGMPAEMPPMGGEMPPEGPTEVPAMTAPGEGGEAPGEIPAPMAPEEEGLAEVPPEGEIPPEEAPPGEEGEEELPIV